MAERCGEDNITQDSSSEHRPPAAGTASWYLEGYTDERKVLRRLPLHPTPFRVGRKSDLPLALNFVNISRVHAELFFKGSALLVQDLDSRNGTFVNRERINGPTVLRPGDVVHFGSVEFRVMSEDMASSGEFGETMDFQGVLPAEFITGSQEFLELLRTEAVCAHFQPLVGLADGAVFGYEALGRGLRPGVAENPYELFQMATSLGMEESLSRMFRRKAVAAAPMLPGSPNVFLNIHPGEMRNPKTLLKSIVEYKEACPQLKLTLEVHESLVTDPQSMKRLAAEIRALDYSLAYDDFGAGQARLIELAEAPPDILKFDRSLVHKLHQAAPQRQQMVEVLVRFARDVGVVTLAEGIESEDEATICRQIGFDCGQGYYFGRPAPISDSATTRCET